MQSVVDELTVQYRFCKQTVAPLSLGGFAAGTLHRLIDSEFIELFGMLAQRFWYWPF